MFARVQQHRRSSIRVGFQQPCMHDCWVPLPFARARVCARMCVCVFTYMRVRVCVPRCVCRVCVCCWFSADAKDCVTALLQKDPAMRLCSGATGGQEIMDHAFFKVRAPLLSLPHSVPCCFYTAAPGHLPCLRVPILAHHRLACVFACALVPWCQPCN